MRCSTMLVFTSHRTGSGFKFYLRIFSLQFCNFSVSFRYFFKTFFGERVELRVVPIFRIKVVLVQAPEEVPQIPQDLDVFARPIRAVEHDRAHELGGLRNRAELTRQIVRFAQMLVGRVRGALAVVNVPGLSAACP